MADRHIADSSMLVRWFIDQPGFEHAREWRQAAIAGDVLLIAPAIARWETGNVLLKKAVRAGLMSAEDLVDALGLIDEVGVEMIDFDADRVARVGQLAIRLGTSFFDAAYGDLALELQTSVVTADVRFANAVSGVVSTDVLRDAATVDPGP